MPNRAVFLDRDHTLMDDPGYVADPAAVRLLPGTELAIKSLVQAGFKTVVVTNQSGVARGLITEEALSRVHEELRRQLADKGAALDAIYYCPYHPEGTVEGYAIDSDLRKPKPGMLLQAAEEMDINLLESWMVGDSARDIEAGQRAGCRTVRIHTHALPTPGEEQDEDVQADFTARNLVDAARIILRETGLLGSHPGAAVGGPVPSAPAALPHAPPQPAPAPAGADEAESLSDRQIRLEVLRYVRQLARAEGHEEFSLAKLIGGIVQVLAVLALVVALWRMTAEASQQAQLWATLAAAMQLMALTLFTMHRGR